MQVRDLLLAQARKLKKEKKGQEQNASMLESLPTELCAEVLKSIPDLCTLSCLLRASPTYFRTYTPIQQEILAAIVSRRFPQGVAVDVIAACISVDFFHTYNTRKKEDVIAFLDRYRHARGSLSLNPFLTPSVRKRALLSIKNLRNIQEGLEVLADEYIRDLNESDYTRELYEDETRTISLSTEQWMRIVRGLCRRQVYTHVFYQPSTDDQPRRVPVPPAPNWDEYIELTEANGLFVATFPPWEQNEIWAVNLWFEDRTSRMLDAVTDPAIDTPKIIPDLYYGSYVFCNMCSHGPMFLARLLRENDLTKQHDIVYDESALPRYAAGGGVQTGYGEQKFLISASDAGPGLEGMLPRSTR
ncbi:hypothetical protein FQN54_006813 [Arachnomyces sp. PD_36]|nr:hypothetical protein FQN54_006813 [Arachnomyces sp. PD_36]